MLAWQVHQFMEDHPDVVLAVAMFCVLMTADAYSAIRAWHKGVKQIKISEAVGG
jgi:hypothetical protein